MSDHQKESGEKRSSYVILFVLWSVDLWCLFTSLILIPSFSFLLNEICKRFCRPHTLVVHHPPRWIMLHDTLEVLPYRSCMRSFGGGVRVHDVLRQFGMVYTVGILVLIIPISKVVFTPITLLKVSCTFSTFFFLQQHPRSSIPALFQECRLLPWPNICK